MYLSLIVEALFFGLLIAIVGLIVHYLTDAFIGQYDNNDMRVFILKLFVIGSIQTCPEI